MVPLLDQERFVPGMLRALQAVLLANDPALLAQYRSAPVLARQQALQALERAVLALWQQATQPGTLKDFFDQQLAEPAAQTEAHRYRQLAWQLLPALEPELGGTYRRHLQQTSQLLLGHGIDNLGCARYLAHLERLWPTPGAFRRLEPGSGLAEVTSTQAEPSGVRFTTAQPEIRAKTLMLLISLAASRGQEGPFFVGLPEMLAYFGYQVGQKANGRYYQLHMAELVMALMHDLPGQWIRLGQSPAVPLLPRPQVVFRDPASTALRALIAPPTPHLPQILRENPVRGFVVNLEPAVLQLLGVGDPRSGTPIPVQVCALRGSRFWLAWWVLHGALPIRASLGWLLDEAGYLQTHRRQGRTWYRAALRQWWTDVGELIELGLLGEPGVYIWRGQREVSPWLSRLLERSERRILADDLEVLQVEFCPPSR